MECWPLSNHKSLLYWLLILMMINIFMVRRVHGGCIEEEREALIEIKASFTSYFSAAEHLLPTWVDGGGAECCDWERVKCNTTTMHVTDLSLRNLRGIVDERHYYDYENTINWPLNVSLFLHFKELRSLNLSMNFLDDGIVSTGLERLSSLKKMEILDLSMDYIKNSSLLSLGALTSLRILDLSYNFHLGGHFPSHGLEWLLNLKNLEMLDLSRTSIKNGSLPSLGALTSLRILDLSDNPHLGGHFPSHEFAALENLEILDLSHCGFYGTLQMQDFEGVSILRKLKTLNLAWNSFNKSLITSLSALPSLKALDISGNPLFGSFPARGPFPAQELAQLTNLEKLDLIGSAVHGTPSIQDCQTLSRLKRLESLTLSFNYFNKSIISCLNALPSLKILDLSYSPIFDWAQTSLPIPIQELSGLRELKILDLSNCHLDSLASNEMHNMPDLEVLLLSDNLFNGTLPMKALASFHHLEVLDLSGNNFVGSIPSAIQALSSLRSVSFAGNKLNGSLPTDGFCEMKNLHELDLSLNMFEGNLPLCFNSLSSLKLFDIYSNQFTGILLPSLIANLTSLEYIDFSHNKFEGSLSFSSFSKHTKLEVVKFINDNNKFEVETEEPVGWIPMFQLKGLVLSNCNINRRTGSVVPSFLLHQHELRGLDLSHNSLDGRFPNWVIENNTMLQVLNLRNNSFGGGFRLPPHRHVNMRSLDMSGNGINGSIPGNTQEFLPCLNHLNLSRNALIGALPYSIGDLSGLRVLDLSNNEFSGEVPKGLFINCPVLQLLVLSSNRLHGEVLSGNLSLGRLNTLLLDNNNFTGEIVNETSASPSLLQALDISNNLFSGLLPCWISNLTTTDITLVARNNSFEGKFPCGTTRFSFLDISHNYFSGPIPSCLDLEDMKHLHFGSNRFTGPIPRSFRKLTDVLTLDMGNNNLSGRIPKFLGELSNLRVLILSKNNFSGSIPKQLCQLNNASFIDLSSNSLSSSIPSCLQNITGPSDLVFIQTTIYESPFMRSYLYHGSVHQRVSDDFDVVTDKFEKLDEVQFTTKSVSRTYKGGILDYMTGLDLSCNKLTGEIPEELGLLIQIRVLNLSNNYLNGSIPMLFSNLANIESLDVSSNCLSGKIPSQLIKLNSLEVFIVAHNNLSGSLPEMKAQFSTFTKESYEGNPLLCGPPLEKKCTTTKSPLVVPSDVQNTDEWYDIDMAWFYGSFSSAWAMFLLGFAAILYINPYWRRKWLDFVEECLYTCYFFFCDLLHKLSLLLYK